MIVTKQRKIYQSPNPHNTAEKYVSSSPHEQKLFLNYRQSIQTIPFNYNSRQRPMEKNHNEMRCYSKKSQKKYDYSVYFQRTSDKQLLNRTHDRIQNARQINKEKPRSNNVSFVLDDYQRRRCSSIKENSPKYKYSSTIQKVKKELSEIHKSCNKVSNNQQKIQIKEYLQSYEPKYKSSSIQSINNSLITSNKENKLTNNRQFFDQKKLENNFAATDKFLQFQTQNKKPDSELSRNKKKHDHQYSRMRNHKQYQLVDQDQQQNYCLGNNILLKKQQGPSSDDQPNFQNLFKSSLIQNAKISDKISRISKLNQQINLRLNQMLSNKKCV